MSLVKLTTKGEVTLPSALREQAGLSVGDLLEAKLKKGGTITLTPKSLIDHHMKKAWMTFARVVLTDRSTVPTK